MPLMNSLQIPVETENVSSRLLLAKQIGASNTQSVIKKKPLVDVGNTFYNRTSVQNVGKPTGKANKPIVGGQNINGNETEQKEKKQNLVQCKTIEDDDEEDLGIVTEPICSCDLYVEDDYDDIFYKDLKLTTSQIEDLALNWENPPIKKEKCEIDCESLVIPDSQFNISNSIADYFEVDYLEIPDIPPVALEMEESFDSGINF